ncbi:MAG TPA: carboxypeptidase regulatory-like domain-containing protein, partial [Terriglobia bacterium]|nr:carboxypeptidase regulatory-like domain-containing protein [Terriglobia bacterium]
REVSFKAVTLKAREFATVAFTLPRNVDGVLVATLYDDQKMPMAERLVFRRPERQLNVRVAPDREDYVPGDKVTLRVTTSDDTGRPVGAMVGLTVTDSSVLELIDKREQAPRLPVMVLLENDVKNLADAHIYLDETNPKARLATDLLLGTQGWRRFATMDISKFVATNGDAARRMLGNSTRIQLVPGGAGGHIGGIVADSSGALIPGVTMTATLVDTNQTATVGTNPSGAYNFSGLPPGRYTLSASLPGFQTKRYTGIQLNPTQTYRYNFQLAVAGVNTQVEVSVAANMILPQQAPAVGQVLEPGRFQDLPLVGNNILDLNRVMDGVRADNIAIVRDGIAMQDLRNVINPDLVGEIRLILQPVDAEQARKAVPERFAAAPIPRAIVVVTREYAHSRRANWTEGSRSDFSETVYWNAGIRTDESTGVATVSFDLSDSVTSFRVMADAFTQDGTLGSITSHVESVKPFSIEPKLPLQVTSGDVIQLPIGIVNGVNRSLGSTEISAKTAAGLKVAMLGDTSSTLRARERTRRLMQIDVGRQLSGAVELAIDASAGPYKDSVRRSLDIQPHGFPYETSSGGVLEPNSSKEVTFTLPQELVRGSAVSSVVVYPSPLANMTQSLQSLLREPHGCFEQTSATSYPMVMAQQYFMTHTGVDPAIIEKTRGLLDSAYKKLTGFQSRSGGYEWFGADPGHEALTAYGFMQFTDMAQVRNVDKDMLDRTGAWLLSRRDGRGGFNR